MTESTLQGIPFLAAAEASNALETAHGRLLAAASAPRKPREIGCEW
jgi:hypothetical protein